MRDGAIVGRGQTQPGGRPHAERVALDNAGLFARGAALYVTLEPCCHWGTTPPCVDAIIAAGVSSVHAALHDPDPRVNGGGFCKMRAAGIAVDIGLGAEPAREILAGFFTRITSGRPLVTVANHFIGSHDGLFIPVPFDATVTAKAGGIVVTTRDAHGETNVANLPGRPVPADAAQTLGKLGLTSVLIPASDPLAQLWRAADLVDRVIAPDADVVYTVARLPSQQATP